MNYPAASSGVSKTTTGKTLRPKGRGIHPDGNKKSLSKIPKSATVRAVVPTAFRIPNFLS